MDKTPEELAEEARLAAEKEKQDAIDRGDIAGEETEEEKAARLAAAADDDDDDDDDDPGDNPDDIQIPKARYDEDRKKSRAEKIALEARIKELEGKKEEKDEPTIEVMETEIEELEDQHEALLLEGEIDKAKAIRRTMNAKRKVVVNRQISESTQSMGKAAVQQIRYDTQLAVHEAAHPTMNEDSPDYDEAVGAEIGVLMDAFSSTMSPAAALNKAVKYVFPAGKEKEKEIDDDDDKADEVREARRIKAAKKALDAVKKTPTNLKDVGKNSDKAGRDDGLPDPLKMSQAQFDKLTEDQKAELRDDKLKAS